MKERFRYLFLAIALLSSLATSAQGDMSNVYDRARTNYEIGRFGEALSLLKGNINQFNASLRRRALRLISLCYLAQDSISLSELYASQLLQENSFYTSVEDPARFEDIISRLKQNKGFTITTASSKEENITEAPVPVTIITSEMIELLGYNKNLGHILAAYVPGITEVVSNNLDNIAMHGAYTSSQEKILIMENGHRLNARSTNGGRIDYSINTDKIDHIEVLRGPASSLYGNVALTAVVNIITKDGSAVNGISAKYGYGSWHTHKADLLAGMHTPNTNLLVWASLYTSQGEDRYVKLGDGYQYSTNFMQVPPLNTDGYAHINKYNKKPSYDVGIRYAFNNFDLMFSRKSGKKVQQYSIFGHAYDDEAYRKFDGQKPGYSVEENHGELSYKLASGPFSLHASVYGDWYSFTDYAVASDKMLYPVFNEDATIKKDENGNDIYTTWIGAYQIYDWKEMTLGSTLRGDYSYNFGRMKGNLLVGGQFEFFSLYDTYALVGEKFDAVQFTISEKENTIQTGNENSLSFFIQDKHYFTNRLILNAGFRYDIKYRGQNKRINAFSPRFALVYIPSKSLSLKMSYSRSFVDAPYFYRRNTDNSYKGGENLSPEYLTAYQLGAIGDVSPLNLKYEVNLYYNKFTDVVNINSKAGIEDDKYRNSGKLETVGVELATQYTIPKFKAYLSACYNKPLSAKDYYYNNRHIYSVPEFTGNLHLLYNITRKLSVRSSVKFAGKYYIPFSAVEADQEIPSSTLFDFGASWKMNKYCLLNVDCENAFDATTYMSGATMTAVMSWFKPGRTLMASLKIKI
jgi:iron complex outermembrane receptor protein